MSDSNASNLSILISKKTVTLRAMIAADEWRVRSMKTADDDVNPNLLFMADWLWRFVRNEDGSVPEEQVARDYILDLNEEQMSDVMSAISSYRTNTQKKESPTTTSE